MADNISMNKKRKAIVAVAALALLTVGDVGGRHSVESHRTAIAPEGFSISVCDTYSPNHICGGMPTVDKAGLVCWTELVEVNPGIEGICGTPEQALHSRVAYWGLPYGVK